jgi:hypothetical protein
VFSPTNAVNRSSSARRLRRCTTRLKPHNAMFADADASADGFRRALDDNSCATLAGTRCIARACRARSRPFQGVGVVLFTSCEIMPPLRAPGPRASRA